VQETNRFLQSCFAATLISRPMTSQRPRLKSQPDDKTLSQVSTWWFGCCKISTVGEIIVDLATDHRTHHHHHHSCEQQHFGPNVGVQVSCCGRPQVVGGCCLTNEINEFLLQKRGHEMGELRESLSSESMFSLTLL
jgi:hypothetical protein